MQLTWQDLKVLIDKMSEEDLSQPVYLFSDFDSTWLTASGTDNFLQEGDVQQIESDGLGSTITGLLYLLVTDEIEDNEIDDHLQKVIDSLSDESQE